MNDLDLFADPSRGGHLPSERLGRRDQRAARKRQRRRRRGSHAATFFALAFLVAVVGGGGLLGYAALRSYMIPPDYVGQGTSQTVVQIRDGDSAKTMGDRLHVAQVVKSSRAFVKVAKKEPRAQSIQPGFYTMRQHMAAAAALTLLLDPKSRAGNQITVPEGLRASQVMQALSKKTGIPLRDFQRAANNPAGLGLPSYAKGRVEGYLFPARYDLNPNASAQAILTMMVDRYKKVAADNDLVARAKLAHVSPARVITMASLIQSESGRHTDMPKVSRVIYNRLKHKPQMNLAFDSTVLYGLGKFGIVASHQDLQSPSPYNTYTHSGLPPGPISNPGEAAIEAVFSPAKGSWLYFVTTDPQRHITEFTDNQKDFAKLKAKLDRYLASHGGG
ncbi:MAG TPA: endolytic transglycosylase MltG [Streptosporangiaceae bacterium]|jgi:UPF0755 protein